MDKYVVAAAGNQTQKIVPLLAGTYLIKFEDDGGRESPSLWSQDSGTILELQPTPAPSQKTCSRVNR